MPSGSLSVISSPINFDQFSGAKSLILAMHKVLSAWNFVNRVDFVDILGAGRFR
jgi:hypothetical protein